MISPQIAEPAVIAVFFVLLLDRLILDWASPATALFIVNQLLKASRQPARFHMRFISSGALLAAQACLLCGKRATTHHQTG